MLLEFQYMLLTAWTSWSGLFKSIPYGDPYLAVFVLIVLVGASAKWVAGGEAA